MDIDRHAPPRRYSLNPGPVFTALARILAEQAGAENGAMFETTIVDELLRWSSWRPAPPSLHFFRAHAGGEIDVVVHAGDRLLAIEVKAARHAHRTDERSLTEVPGAINVRGLVRNAWRLGLVVARGREVETLAPGVWAIPDWRLFGPAG